MIAIASIIRVNFVPLLLSALFSGCQASSPLRQGGGLDSLEQAKRAFLDSWTKHEGETWTVDRLSRVLDNSDAFLSFDAMSSDKTVVRSYKDYAAIWGPGMAAFKTAQLSETENVGVWISDEMAVTASIVRIHGELGDGTKLDIPGHMTLVWNRGADGWRLAHEHMSTGVKP